MASEESKDAGTEEALKQNRQVGNGRTTEAVGKGSDEPESKPKKNTVPKKRKAEKDDQPTKAPRRSARGAEKAPIEPIKVINFLLSPEAGDLCRPREEAAAVAEKGAEFRTYSSQGFSPFEELMCATILSRPISHALGLRSIRTLLNEPHNFTTPKAIMDAGFDKVRIALDNARTQHRQKTAEQLCTLASVVSEKFNEGEDEVGMEKLRQDSSKDIDQVFSSRLRPMIIF